MCFTSPKPPRIPKAPEAPAAPEPAAREVRVNSAVKKRRRASLDGLSQFRIPLNAQRPLNTP